MPYVNDDALVETDWLAKHLGTPEVRVLDASYYLPNEGRDTKAEFLAGHIQAPALEEGQFGWRDLPTDQA